MEKVRPWCGQPSDRGRLRAEQNTVVHIAHCNTYFSYLCSVFYPQHAVRIFTQSISAKILLVSKKVSNVVSRLVLIKNKWMNSKHLQMHTGL